MLPFFSHGFDALGALAGLLKGDRDRVVRLWAKRLRGELQELELPGKDRREPLHVLLEELARLLRERGEDAMWLWPEELRAHAVRRYEQRFAPEDLARELKALQLALLRAYARANKGLEPEMAELIAELVGEAGASMHAAYARVLRTEEVRFREAAVMESILHHVEVGILLADPDGTIGYATPPVAAILGVPVGDLIGLKPDEGLAVVLSGLEARHPAGEPFGVADLPWLRAMRERTPQSGTMLVKRREDHREVVVEMHATPLLDEGARGDAPPLGVIQSIADRTEASRANRDLSRAYEELRWLNRRLLQRARHQAVGQMASGAAHALNNFLNVMQLRVAQLRREFRPEHLDTLDRTVRSAGDLVRRLQEYSAEHVGEQRVPVEADRAVEEALELVQPEFEDPGEPARLVRHLRADGTRVLADAAMLRELVVNLASGARDRLPAGGTLHVETAKRDHRFELRMWDDGRPLSDDERMLLFDPLHAGAAPHLALFLAAGKRQVESWGGTLEVRNRSERGVECVVRIPVLPEDRAALPPAPRPPGPRRACGLVLVVDDDLENARVMADVLREEGHDVSVATDAASAEQLWAARRYNAALLDVRMPDVSGWELARRLKKTNPHAAFAMVTGGDVRRREDDVEVDAIFRKPVDLAALDEFLSCLPH